MNGSYVGYVAGDDPLHGFLGRIVRDQMGVRETHPAFRAFRLSGSNVVYAYQEKFSHVKIICKFYGPRFSPDMDKAAWKARQEYEGLNTLRRYNLIGSPHHVIRPLDFSRDINGVLAVEYYAGEESATRSRAPPSTGTTRTCTGGSRRWRIFSPPSTTGRPTGPASTSTPTAGTSTRSRAAQEGAPYRVARRRRAVTVARPLARAAQDVAGPAGLAARRRHAGELPFRSRNGRRGDRPGADEAR